MVPASPARLMRGLRSNGWPSPGMSIVAGKWLSRLALAAAAILYCNGCGMLIPSELVEMGRDAKLFAERYPDGFETRAGLYTAVAGSGDVNLVLVHGSPGDWRAHAAYLLDEELQRRFRMFSPDRPGYGKSEPGVATGSLAEQARRLVEMVGPRGGPVIWAGHSFGASIIARAAVNHPQRVDGLALVAGAMDPELEHPRWWHRLGDTRLARRLLPPMWDVANQEAIAFEHGLDELAPSWGEIRCPTVILHGRKDRLADPRHVDWTVARMTGAPVRTVWLDDGDHFLLWNRVEVVKRALLELADEL